MIPDNVYDLPSMRAVIGDEETEAFQCPICPRVETDLKCTDDLGDSSLPRFVCMTCASGPHRLALAKQKEEAQRNISPWDTEPGIYFKIVRDRLITDSLWADAPGSPLTPACQQAWTSWRASMHRLTVDFNGPDEAIMPEQPNLEYGE